MLQEIINLLPEEKRETAKTYLESLTDMKTVTKENADDFLKGNSFLLSAVDSRVSKGIEKYKSESFDKAVEAKVAEIKKELDLKYNPTKTEAEKRMDELEAKLLASENEKISFQQEKLVKSILNTHKEKGFDLSFFDVSKMLGKTDEETTLNVEKAITPYLELRAKDVEKFNEILQKEVDKKLAGNPKPSIGSVDNKTKRTLTEIHAESNAKAGYN